MSFFEFFYYFFNFVIGQEHMSSEPLWIFDCVHVYLVMRKRRKCSHGGNQGSVSWQSLVLLPWLVCVCSCERELNGVIILGVV